MSETSNTPHYLNAQLGCTCFYGSETWHAGVFATEYHLEPNPDCPAHFPKPPLAEALRQEADSIGLNDPRLADLLNRAVLAITLAANTKYEYTAAVKHVSGFCEPVGIAFAEDEYPDAKTRALGEYYDWKHETRSIDPQPEIVLLHRPISIWEECADGVQ